MPNHVINYIEIKGESREIEKLLDTIKSDEHGVGTIDFNKIIPMPEALAIEAGTKTDRGLKAYRDFIEIYTLAGTINTDKLQDIPAESEKLFLRQRRDIRRDEWDAGKTAWQNIQNYGAATWYDWCVAHWGTKWNAYGFGAESSNSPGDSAISFQTAWSAPHPILEKLSERYPHLTFAHSWADEDIGINCGRYTYSGGGRVEEYVPDREVEAMEFAADMWDKELSEWEYYKNTAGTKYIWGDGESYELVELFGKPALFSNTRLTDENTPEGLCHYDLRLSDDGDRFCSVEPYVRVNHGGSVITDEPIAFGKDGYLTLDENTSPNFIGQTMTLTEYMNGNFEQDGGMKLE